MVDEFTFPGSLGALVAISFVMLELLLLPLFEYTRESLTIAIVRSRAAQGKKFKICPERSIAIALGLSDGLSGYSSFTVAPRILKIFFKVSLLVSVFAWEFQLDTVERAEYISFHFNNQGPSGPKNESSIMFPFPVVGSPEIPIPPNTVQSNSSNRRNKSYTLQTVRGIRFDFAAHCISVGDNGRRSVFLGIYGHDKFGHRKIYCLNGTDSRERAEALSYNQDPRKVVRSFLSSFVVGKQILKVDNDTLLYTVKATVPTAAVINGTHNGFVRVYRSKITESVYIWIAYGFLVHSTKGTVMMFHHLRRPGDEAGMHCQNKQIPVRYPNYSCLFDFNHLQDVRFEFFGNQTPTVQDIDLRLREHPLFRVGKTRNVILSWLEAGRVGGMGVNFADELWHNMLYHTFYFSEPRTKKLSLRLGAPKIHVRMRIWSSVILLVIVTLFSVYCLTSCALNYQSRIRTGINSECVTRTAVMDLLGQEAIVRGMRFHDEAETSLTIEMSNTGSANQYIRLSSETELEER